MLLQDEPITDQNWLRSPIIGGLRRWTLGGAVSLVVARLFWPRVR